MPFEPAQAVAAAVEQPPEANDLISLEQHIQAHFLQQCQHQSNNFLRG
jgi:predicted chitinase